MIPVGIHYIDSEATRPTMATDGSAGYDLYACLLGGKSVRVPPGKVVLVPTGIKMAIPEGWEGQVRPRSGLATKKLLTMPNAPGTIDSDYRGEIKVPIINLGDEVGAIHHHQRIAQIVFGRCYRVEWVLGLGDDTERGEGGFGSTGT